MLFDPRTRRTTRLVIVICALAVLPLLAQRELAIEQAGLQKPRLFSPTQAPADAKYVGTQACVLCHAEQAAAQPNTPMGKALHAAADCQILREHPALEFRQGDYTYKIARTGQQSVYTVTDGKHTFSAPILWCFGLGKAGQTYVFGHNGQLYESRISFYKETKALDLTLGALGSTPRSIEEAAGRLMHSAETKECFSCHATAAVSEGRLQLDKLTPGVNCEACHGPGAEHVALAKAGRVQAAPDKQIFNPAHLNPYDLSQQFCGACHRSWEQVMMMRVQGVANVRFQPYRLHYSPCYDPEDQRITCTACHDPHKPLAQGATAYDAKCLACHQTKTTAQRAAQTVGHSKAKACRVGTEKCASCHMPEYEMPGSHFKFTDHMIRIVKLNEPYPN